MAFTVRVHSWLAGAGNMLVAQGQAEGPGDGAVAVAGCILPLEIEKWSKANCEAAGPRRWATSTGMVKAISWASVIQYPEVLRNAKNIYYANSRGIELPIVAGL